MNLVFVTRCIEANGDDINEMTDIPQQQGLSTTHFIETVATKAGIDKEVLDMLGYDTKRAFAKDWHMTAAKSLYQGIPCYYSYTARSSTFLSPRRMRTRCWVFSKRKSGKAGCMALAKCSTMRWQS